MNQETEFKGFLESTLMRSSREGSSREGRNVDALLRNEGYLGCLDGRNGDGGGLGE